MPPVREYKVIQVDEEIQKIVKNELEQEVDLGDARFQIVIAQAIQRVATAMLTQSPFLSIADIKDLSDVVKKMSDQVAKNRDMQILEKRVAELEDKMKLDNLNQKKARKNVSDDQPKPEWTTNTNES